MSATPNIDSKTKKRTRYSSSPQLDYKKIKQCLSISSSEGDSIVEEPTDSVEQPVVDDPLESAVINMDEQKLKTLLDSMRIELIQQIKTEFRAEIREAVRDAVEESIQGVEMRLDDLEAENVDLKEQIKTLKDERDEALATAKDAKAQAVANEQHSRKSSVRIFGLKEQDDEDSMKIVLDLFKEKLGLPFTRQDLSTAHRVGVKKPDQPRAMLVAFLRIDDCKTTIRMRKRLKSTGIVIVDDLTRETHQLFNRVKKDPKIDSAWTVDGKVKIKTKDGKIHHIKYGQTLDELLK